MLSLLSVKQLALVDAMDIEWGPGFSVITGESGAGKSLILQGLDLALGGKADAGRIRQGFERAEVTACFDVGRLTDALGWLQERALDDGVELVLRRVVSRDGRSRAFINGSQVNVAELRDLASHLMEICGQHEHQSLLRRDSHRNLLDRYASLTSLAQQTALAWREWQTSLTALSRLEEQRRQQQERLELVERQLSDLDQLGLKRGELVQIEAEFDALAHVDSRREHLLAVGAILEHDEGGVLSALNQIRQHLSVLGGTAALWSNLAETAFNDLHELDREVRHAMEHLEADPERLSWLDDRLAAIHRLARKMQSEASALPDMHEQLEAERLRLLEEQSEQALRVKVEAAAAEFSRLAQELALARRDAAGRFAEQVMQHFPLLGLEHAALEFRFTPLEVADSRGLDDIELFFSANPGVLARPLARVASGGELSRISLALQVVYAQHVDVPTMVFDEVDVGVSGSVAESVGRLLRQLGQRAQILCITHQPQVAAQGHQHWLVEKLLEEGQVRSRMMLLDTEQRIDELARISGGLAISRATLEHARALLEGDTDA